MKKILLVVLMIVAVLTLTGCQTIHGLGSDVKWTGEKMEEITD